MQDEIYNKIINTVKRCIVVVAWIFKIIICFLYFFTIVSMMLYFILSIPNYLITSAIVPYDVAKFGDPYVYLQTYNALDCMK